MARRRGFYILKSMPRSTTPRIAFKLRRSILAGRTCLDTVAQADELGFALLGTDRKSGRRVRIDTRSPADVRFTPVALLDSCFSFLCFYLDLLLAPLTSSHG